MSANGTLRCIDVGSNSIRCMDAAGTVRAPQFSEKRVFTTRLAEGLTETDRLSEARMRQSLGVLSMLAEEARAAGLPLRAYATSAVRDAANRDAFLRPAEALLGRAVDVLSGTEEAALAFRAATNDTGGGMLDIGGGSTQAVCPPYAASFPLGCVRARDRFLEAPFDALYASMLPLLTETYAALPAFPPCAWTGVGGTITTLGALLNGLDTYDRARVHGCSIRRGAQLGKLAELADMGDASRAAIPLLAARHDVILHGGALLAYLMARVGCDMLRVSDTDGLEGYALTLLPD